MDLTRKLEPKSKWDKYFPKSECKPVLLGEGYTDFGVRQMRDWAQKYAWQTRSLTNALKAETVPETLKNIHRFVYRNFQYAPDGAVQHIQSPACAWASRERGMNCKGYSVMVSSILHNLGLDHIIRRVKYPGKDDYTHVFIVVPYRGKEYIIDGTLPQFNYTTPFQTKKDLKVMPEKLQYVGLQAPEGVRSIAKRNVLKLLAENGYSSNDIYYASELLKKHPLLLTPQGVKIGNKVFPIMKGLNWGGVGFNTGGFGFNTGGFGFNTGGFGYNSGFPTSNNFQTPGNFSNNNPIGQQGQNQEGWVKKTWDGIKDAIQWISSTYNEIKDLMCYNSVWPPEKGKWEAESHMKKIERKINLINQKYLKKGIKSVINDINELSRYVAGWQVDTIGVYNRGGWKTCSKQTVRNLIIPAHNQGKQIVDDFITSLLSGTEYHTETRTDTNNGANYEYTYYVVDGAYGSISPGGKTKKSGAALLGLLAAGTALLINKN